MIMIMMIVHRNERVTRKLEKTICQHRAQLFTSMQANLRQDINGGFAFAGALMEHFLEGFALL